MKVITGIGSWYATKRERKKVSNKHLIEKEDKDKDKEQEQNEKGLSG